MASVDRLLLTWHEASVRNGDVPYFGLWIQQLLLPPVGRTALQFRIGSLQASSQTCFFRLGPGFRGLFFLRNRSVKSG
jgi:hypothetical protein